VATAFRFTSADLEKFPDIDGVRYEIIDGEIHVSRQADECHQYACGILAFTLHQWSVQSGAGMALLAPGLVFSSDDNVIPDVVWISHGRRALARDEKGHYRIAPELVVEVVSPGSVNALRDRELKLGLYSRQGVLEYWIADWQEHNVDVFRVKDARLQLVDTLSDESTLTSPLLPGFSCAVSTLWVPPINP